MKTIRNLLCIISILCVGQLKSQVKKIDMNTFDHQIYLFDIYKSIPEDTSLWNMINKYKVNYNFGDGLIYLNDSSKQYLNIRGNGTDLSTYIWYIEIGSVMLTDFSHYPQLIKTKDEFKSNTGVYLNMTEDEFLKTHSYIKRKEVHGDFTKYFFYVPNHYVDWEENIASIACAVTYIFHKNSLITLIISDQFRPYKDINFKNEMLIYDR